MRTVRANLRVVVSSVLAAVVLVGAGAADAALPQPPAGPAPTVQAVEVEKGPGVFQAAPAEAEPALGPQHQPIDQIPFMPMPEPQTDDDGEPHVFGPLLMHDAETGETIELPVPADVLPTGGGYGGYSGADGGQYGDEMELSNAPLGFGDMAKIWNPEDVPWRRNCKVVMRFWATAPIATDIFACCSGSMVDAETVLTAGHCVYSHEPDGWVINDYAEEIWVYPGWDGVGGQFNEPPTTVNHYGYGRGTYFYAASGWVNSGDLDEDCALIRVTRAVGMLTGWFGTDYGEDCSWYTSHGLHNASFPSECCNEPSCTLHTGSDMYYWNGLVDSCPWNQLQIDTTGGCFNAGWGGMSGSGMYYWDGGDGRWVHAVCSTSDRSTWTRYCQLWGSFVTYMNNTFIPGSRGSTFDLQPLDVNAEPASIPAGGATTLLNHDAVNATNNNPSGSTGYNFKVYLSTNEFISTGDTLLSSQSFNWDFAAMQSLGVNMAAVTIPAETPPGDYWIGVLYDSSTDYNSGNNNTEGWDSAPITVTCPSQSAPTGVAATDGTYTSYVRITWSAPTGATQYRVYRATSSGGTKTALGSWQSGTSYNDTGATPGVT